MKVQLVKSYCLPLLVYCIGALRLKRSTSLYNTYLFVGTMPFEKIFIISVLSQWRCYKYNLVLWIFLICMTFADGIFGVLCLKNVIFGAIFWPCWTWSFTAVLILHTFMVIVLTVVVSETVLLAIVCNCVHCSLLFSSIFVLHSLRIKIYMRCRSNLELLCWV